MMNRIAITLGVGLVFAALVPGAWSADPPVQLTEDEASFTLANGIVTARIEKRAGVLASLKYRDLEMLGKASGRAFGYWSHNGGGSLGSSRMASVIVNPATNGGERGIVSCKFLHGEGGGSLPADVELRFALGRGDAGIYVYAIWTHKPEYPTLRLGEARYTLKLNERVFDYLTIDARRRKVMPTPADWDQGVPLNMKEVRRLTTGIYAGQPEHKYDYSAVQFETPAFGWSSTKHHIGLWIVNPTIEYLGGGPTKVELTGHLDVNPGAAPTLCNYWVGSHYGGSSFLVAAGESWSKVVGPMLIHCNAAPSHEAMWTAALAQAQKEAAAWPYDWAGDSEYLTRAQRGTVAGQILVTDPLVSMERVSNLLVGATPQTVASARGGASADWQKDARSYQFWVRADKNGRFTIPNIRPGTYTLRAFADGVLGEFSLPDLAVAAGKTQELGRLEWKPVRQGRQLWEIGIPNRSAAEFKHGDHYWQWGLYYEYPMEFPNDVNFVIGKSDWKRDWNYCQPPRLEGNRVGPTTWSITFDLPQAPAGKAALRLAFAGSRGRGGIQLGVNGKPAGATGPLPDTGVMHRDGIRGYWFERTVAFDAALLRAGTNILTLHNPARSWVDGVLYDYLRLELDDTATAPKMK